MNEKNEKKEFNLKRIQISVSLETYEIIEEIRKRYGVTKSSLINSLIAKYAEKEYGLGK